jgi:hypothetical protein
LGAPSRGAATRACCKRGRKAGHQRQAQSLTSVSVASGMRTPSGWGDTGAQWRRRTGGCQGGRRWNAIPPPTAPTDRSRRRLIRHLDTCRPGRPVRTPSEGRTRAPRLGDPVARGSVAFGVEHACAGTPGLYLIAPACHRTRNDNGKERDAARKGGHGSVPTGWAGRP